MEIVDDRPVDVFVYECGTCKSKMIFKMTFFFESDIDVYCPCTNIMNFIGDKE